MLLSLPVRLFLHFVIKVQYISTYQKTEWSRCHLQLLLLPFDFGLYQTVDIHVAILNVKVNMSSY